VNGDGFPETLFESLADERRVRAAGDTFGVLGLSRNELAHSAMLAWLLDPYGRHSLGDLTIRGILDRWFPGAAPDGLPVRRVEREVARFETRANIVAWGDGWTCPVPKATSTGSTSPRSGSGSSPRSSTPGAPSPALSTTRPRRVRPGPPLEVVG